MGGRMDEETCEWTLAYDDAAIKEFERAVADAYYCSIRQGWNLTTKWLVVSNTDMIVACRKILVGMFASVANVLTVDAECTIYSVL